MGATTLTVPASVLVQERRAGRPPRPARARPSRTPPLPRGAVRFWRLAGGAGPRCGRPHRQHHDNQVLEGLGPASVPSWTRAPRARRGSRPTCELQSRSVASRTWPTLPGGPYELVRGHGLDRVHEQHGRALDARQLHDAADLGLGDHADRVAAAPPASPSVPRAAAPGAWTPRPVAYRTPPPGTSPAPRATPAATWSRSVGLADPGLAAEQHHGARDEAPPRTGPAPRAHRTARLGPASGCDSAMGTAPRPRAPRSGGVPRGPGLDQGFHSPQARHALPSGAPSAAGLADVPALLGAIQTARGAR